MFSKGEIWAYPTDTSFGLGARADDPDSLSRLKELKKRDETKYFSLMVRDWAMLNEYAEVPPFLTPWNFIDKPFTAILKPTDKLPQSDFWPKDKVAFRVCTLPDIANHIKCPVTATSANFSGEEPFYGLGLLKEAFGDSLSYYEEETLLTVVDPSEIWDFTQEPPVKLR